MDDGKKNVENKTAKRENGWADEKPKTDWKSRQVNRLFESVETVEMVDETFQPQSCWLVKIGRQSSSSWARFIFKTPPVSLVSTRSTKTYAWLFWLTFLPDFSAWLFCLIFRLTSHLIENLEENGMKGKGRREKGKAEVRREERKRQKEERKRGGEQGGVSPVRTRQDATSMATALRWMQQLNSTRLDLTNIQDTTHLQ